MKEGDCLAESKLDEILRTRQAPGVSGLDSGPGHSRGQMHFDRPDPYYNGLKTARMMEDAGQLKDPKLRKMVEFKVQKLKEQEPTREKIDYQVDGHPIERSDSDE
jgi:hypothetical protein